MLAPLNQSSVPIMDEYRAYIENLALTDSTDTFWNSGADRACIVMSQIFKSSKRELRILAGTLGGEVSKGDYVRELNYFLVRGGKLTVLVEDPKPENNPDLFNLLRFYNLFTPEKIKVMTVKNDLIHSETQKKIHLTIGDDKIYRAELDTETYQANGSFNAIDDAKHMISLFDKLALTGKPFFAAA